MRRASDWQKVDKQVEGYIELVSGLMSKRVALKHRKRQLH